jgi:hypothetical protein
VSADEHVRNGASRRARAAALAALFVRPTGRLCALRGRDGRQHARAVERFRAQGPAYWYGVSRLSTKASNEIPGAAPVVVGISVEAEAFVEALRTGHRSACV